MEGLRLPVKVAYGVFEEAGNVLERSPPLGVVTRLPGLVHELAEVTIGVLSQSSNQTQQRGEMSVGVAQAVLTFRSYRLFR